MASEETLLCVESVNVNFGGLKALKDIHCQIKSGEVVGLIGPNGAGKTTLFNVLSGIVRPDSGTLTVSGVKRDWLEPHELVHHQIARTLQGVGLFGDLTVLENVMIDPLVDVADAAARLVIPRAIGVIDVAGAEGLRLDKVGAHLEQR